MPDLIGSLKKLIESQDFCNRYKKRPKDFSRNRALPFKNLIYYMINLPMAAYETELGKQQGHLKYQLLWRRAGIDIQSDVAAIPDSAYSSGLPATLSTPAWRGPCPG